MARVLVVDDAAFMRKMVTDALTKGGHEVVGEAGNGAEAIDRFQELKPDLTTLDITMPEKDGIAALKEIIELDPAARVIMCSALRAGVQGARIDQAGRQGLRREALPGEPCDRRRRQGARLSAFAGGAACRPAVPAPGYPTSRAASPGRGPRLDHHAGASDARRTAAHRSPRRSATPPTGADTSAASSA